MLRRIEVTGCSSYIPAKGTLTPDYWKIATCVGFSNKATDPISPKNKDMECFQSEHQTKVMP